MTFLQLKVETALFSGDVNYTSMRVHDCVPYDMWVNSNVNFLTAIVAGLAPGIA